MERRQHPDPYGRATPVLYIVDWDDVLLAPKESDLMFIGGGIDEIWKTERERSYGWFQSNFEPEATIEIADATYYSITENPNSARW